MSEYQFRRLPASSLPAVALSGRKTGSKDGEGAGDHDQPFAGFRAYQFSTRQLVRLLLLRGEVLEAKLRSSLLAV